MTLKPHSLKKSAGRLWRRLALAIPVSVLLHLLVAVLMRPQYQQVADFAVDLDVIEVAPGPPAKAVSAKPEPEPEPAPAPRPKKKPPPSTKQIAAKIEKIPLPRNIGRDGGIAGTDAGVGEEGGGICMHNLFAYSEPNPSWILWLSMASFRDTVFQADIARFLSTYKFSRRIMSQTGLESTSVEGLFISTDNVFDWQAYRVVVSYDSGEEKLRRELDKNSNKPPGLSWLQTTQGWEATVPGDFRYHLGSSGRVLAVTHAPALPPTAVRQTATDTDGGAAEKVPVGPGAFSDWPSQVECLSARQQAAEDKAKKVAAKQTEELLETARGFLVPDRDGHWPVVLLATRDPRTVGIGLHRKEFGFKLATVRIYFTDPIRIEGQAILSAEKETIELFAEGLRQSASAASADPFMAMAGLSKLFNNLVLVAKPNKLGFTMTLTENQTKAALIFLQLQGAALERRLERQKNN
ncbi:MAG: hypothetical protein GY762_07515 [Proteobacteria bacterium]|nr:hypothetical protein [Pseudomonadota bacterium]